MLMAFLGLGSYADIFSMMILSLVVLAGISVFLPLIIGGQVFLGRSLNDGFSYQDVLRDLSTTEVFHAVSNSLYHGQVCWDNVLCAAGTGLRGQEQARTAVE